MGAKQSKLSNPHYGYNMVLATTQASVNATMEEWHHWWRLPVSRPIFIRTVKCMDRQMVDNLYL